MLRNAGHDVLNLNEEFPSLSDIEIIKLAETEGRIIVTCDSDFGELMFKGEVIFTKGIIYFRLNRFAPNEPAAFILEQIKEFGTKFEGRFTVISRNRIRQKQL